ncbi:hypothetical protein NQ317_013769 [Molorchus minor]|uniref:3-hydroxyisobutyryl-CoA hydrolase, mitochondrial n=1 Tax=Molorchus minor TaxID=1323400 RepID=A0ABQ9JR62_9CUCU|nr:hypothetical protein NQ317_013769 [Molorchus minor]
MYEHLSNNLVVTYGTPYITIIDGLTMGSTAGTAVLGQYSVATERTVFAMPEAQIGFFPDGGCSYSFPRLRKHLGWYLALTGQKLKGPDVVKAGLATHYCDSKNVPDLEQALLTKDSSVEEVLKKFNKVIDTDFSMESLLDQIDYCFSGETIEEVVARLSSDDSEWGKKTLNILNRMSPTSLKIIFRELAMGKKLSKKECFLMEYRLAINCLNSKDFREGIRALLMERDAKPKWDPPTLSQVSDEYVESFFREMPGEEELRAELT